MPTPIISGPQKTFRPVLPGHSFVEYEGSTITIPLTVKLPRGELKTGPIVTVHGSGLVCTRN